MFGRGGRRLTAIAAEALLMHATEIEPDYLRANSLIACMRTARALLGIVDPTANLAAAQEMAEHAIQRDPIDPSTHFAAGFSYMVARRFDRQSKL
jgi:hypothetical protein